MTDDRDARDSALDTLLREHSTETPPAHLDAAILAAAHRAVAARPRPALATQAWRWGMPLAAAAAIGLVVIGILPLAPSLVGVPGSTVSDVPGGASSMAGHAAEGPPPARIAEAPDHAAPLAPATPAPPPAARADRKAAARSPAPATLPAPTLERREAVAEQRPRDRAAAGASSTRNGAAADAAPAPQVPAPAASRSGDGASRFSSSTVGSSAGEPHPTAASGDGFGARAHTVDEWIDRLRALRRRGDIPEALRTLSDFRAAFGDVDARLPADLREWASALPRLDANPR